MRTLKRICAVLCAILLVSENGFFLPSYAEGEDPDFSDTSYWNSLCTSPESLSDKDAENCRAYTQYMQEKNTELQQQIADIDSRKAEISAKISDYDKEITAYNAQIAGITGMIQDLSMQITAVEEQIADIQAKIEVNEAAIEEKQDNIDSLKDKVSKRLVEEQKTMRTYQFLDILMGAESFEDFIRLAGGINDIYAYDSHSLSQLNDGISELEQMKEELVNDRKEVETMEAELETGRQMLDSQQAALLSSRYELEVLQQSYNEQLAGAENEKADAQNAIAANQDAIDDIGDSLDKRDEQKAKEAEEAKKENSDSGTESKTDSGETSETAEPAEKPAAAPASTPVSSGGGSYEPPETGNTGGNPYYGGWSNCTWGTWQLVHDTLGISLPGWGMAGNWMNDAARAGYATGSTPRVHSIAVYSWHVAFVTAVDGDMVYIKEGNYLGHYYERWVPAEGLPYTGQTCLGYIYL